MMYRACSGVVVLTALLALPAIALGQGSGTTSVDLSTTEPGGEPSDFTFWHTGEGEAGQSLLAEKCHLGFASRMRSEQSDEQSA
jgi:hypothetical protein